MKAKKRSMLRLFVFAILASGLLIACGQEEPDPSASGDKTPSAVLEPAGESDVPEMSETVTDDATATGTATEMENARKGQPQAAEARLATAMRILKANASDLEPRNIGFTDWTLAKEYMDLPNLDGTSSDEEKRDFVIGFGANQVAGAGEWLGSDSYRSTWGFDVDWELGEESYSVLKFRDGFDFEEWRQQLLSQSYIEEDGYQGAIVLSTEDLSVPFRRRNVVYLTEENILVLSGEARSDSMLGALDIVDLIKENSEGLMADDAIADTAAQLGETAAAIITLNRCTMPSMHPFTYLSEYLLPSAVTDNINQYLDEKGAEMIFSAHDYEVFGMGYRYEDGLPVVVLVFHYADPTDARADLSMRREVIANGPSLLHKSLGYADLHSVTDSYVEGNNLVLELQPAQNNPTVQFDMVRNREIFLTMCSY